MPMQASMSRRASPESARARSIASRRRARAMWGALSRGRATPTPTTATPGLPTGDLLGVVVHLGHDLVEELADHGLRIGAGGGGAEDEVAGTGIDERLQLLDDLVGGSRRGHVVDHGTEVAEVRAAHRPGRLLAGGVAVVVDVEEDP